MGKTFTVSEVMQIMRDSYLNDSSASIYTNAKLLPKVKLAYMSLETELQKHEIACGQATAEGLLVLAGQKVIPTPGDFLFPVALFERNQGSTDRYDEMVYKRWNPDISISTQLGYFDFLGDVIHTPGATTNREIKMQYYKLFPALSDTGNDFVLAKAEQYLASRASALVHGFSSQNMELAGICKQEAEDNLEQILQIYIHRNQAAPVRRKGYSPPYRY